MNYIETDINSYKIFKNKNSSKFRVKYLTETYFSELLRNLGIKRTPKHEWKLFRTDDRDVPYDFNSLERAQEAINRRIQHYKTLQQQNENDSEWSELE